MKQSPTTFCATAPCQKCLDPHLSKIISTVAPEYDITAGKAAGVQTVGALYGFSREEIFRMNRPDFEISSADQLVGLF